jgi:hypothetical protein
MGKKLPDDDERRGHRTFLWFYRINNNPKYQRVDLSVAVRLTEFVNKKTGDAYPSAKTLGSSIDISERSVLRSIRRLEEGGDLGVEWGAAGRGHSNRYWPILPVLDDEKTGKTTPVLDDGKPASGTEKTGICDTKTGIHGNKTGKAMPENHTNHKKNHGGNHTARAAPQNDFSQAGCMATAEPSPAAGFKAFWSDYPKQVGEHAAEREYGKALQDGATAAEINDGARRYATDAERIERGDRYTKDAVNWLKQRKWADKTTGDTIDEDGNTITRPFKTTGVANVHDVGQRVLAMIKANGGRV